MEKRILVFILTLFMVSACSKRETPEDKGTGYLTLNITNGSTSLKAGVEITDFTLRISDGYAEVLKERIGDLPEQIALSAGVYAIEACSADFSEPRFDMPFYSGKTTVEIEAGETKEASLICAQGNAGIKVVWSKDFPILYGTYQAQINCNEGYLTYSPTEERTGYFLPGTVSISIMADGLTINGGTITLAAKDMVTATLRPKEMPSGSLTVEITVDDSVNPREVEVIVDPDSDFTGENSDTNPYNITQAITRQGETAVWIRGYIVGSNPSTTSTYDFRNPATWQATNIVLADGTGVTDSNKCIFVSLPSSGAARTNLNLISHPENLNHRLTIKGNLGTYLSRNGLTNVSSSNTISSVYILE